MRWQAGTALTLVALLAGCTGRPAPVPAAEPAGTAAAPAPAGSAAAGPGAGGAGGAPAATPVPAAAPAATPAPLPPPGPPPGYAFPAAVAPARLPGEWAPAGNLGGIGRGRWSHPLHASLSVEKRQTLFAPGAPVTFTVTVLNLSDGPMAIDGLEVPVEARLHGRPVWRGSLPPLQARLERFDQVSITAGWNQRDAAGRPVPGGQAYDLVLVTGRSFSYADGTGRPATAVLEPNYDTSVEFALTLAPDRAVTGTSYGPFVGSSRDGEVRAAATRVHMTPESTLVHGVIQSRREASTPDTSGLHLLAALPGGEVALDRRDQQYRQAPAPDPGYRTAEGFAATFAPVPAGATLLRLVKLDPVAGAVVWQVVVPLPGTGAAAAPEADGAWVKARVQQVPPGTRGFPLAAGLTMVAEGGRVAPGKPVAYQVSLLNASPERLILNGAVLRVEVRQAAEATSPIWSADLPPLALELGPGEGVSGEFAWDLKDALGRRVTPGRSFMLQLVPGPLPATGARGAVMAALEASPRTRAPFIVPFPPGGAAVATLAGPFTGSSRDGTLKAVVARVQLTEAGALLTGTLYAQQAAALGARGRLQLIAQAPARTVLLPALGLLPGGAGSPDPAYGASQNWEASFDPVPAGTTALMLQELDPSGATRWQVPVPLPAPANAN